MKCLLCKARGWEEPGDSLSCVVDVYARQDQDDDSPSLDVSQEDLGYCAWHISVFFAWLSEQHAFLRFLDRQERAIAGEPDKEEGKRS